jgi:hypothetical protein
MDLSPYRVDVSDLLVASIDTTVAAPFGAYLFVGNDPAAEIARSLERSVFLEAFGNTPALLFNEYNRYEPASVFICVIDHRRATCAGMMRVIVPIDDGPGLKSFVDVEPVWGQTPEALFEESGFTFEPEATWDIATLAVAPEYRSAASLGLMHIGLYQSLARIAQRFEVRWLIAILDYAVYRLIRLQLRRTFTAFAGERPYLGSERSVPACCLLRSIEVDLATSDPTLHEVIYEGSAVSAAVRPIEVDSSVERVERIFDKIRSPALET